MTVGFQSWGQDGSFIQLDSDYRCLRLTDHRTQPMQDYTNNYFGLQNGLNTAGNTFVTYYYAQVQIAGAYPIVCFRSQSPTIQACWNVAPNQWVYMFICQLNLPIEFWVFNELLPTPSNVGIQIKKTDGTVVFDGNDSPAKIMDYIQSNYNPGNVFGGEQVIRDYGRGDWAVCINNFSSNKVIGNVRVNGQPYSGSWFIGKGVRTLGNQLVAGHWTFNSLLGYSTDMFPANSYFMQNYLVVDLSRL